MDVNLQLLKAISDAQVAGQPFYVSSDEGVPLVNHQPALIAVDASKPDPTNPSKIAALVTADGAALLASPPSNGNATPSKFAVISGFVPPKIARGRGGDGGRIGTAKYPFEDMPVGGSFFVGNSEVKGNNAMKTLSSAVGSANERFKEATGATETKTRAKRGKDHKTVKGPDGNNIMETVTLPVRKSTRKFSVRAVKAGVAYGEFKPSEDGAVAYRTE